MRSRCGTAEPARAEAPPRPRRASGEYSRYPGRAGTAGFALPAAILAMVVVGFLVTGGIHVATQESRIGQASERATRAFYVAESGMNTVLGTFNPQTANLAIWGTPGTMSGSFDQGEWEAEIRRVDDVLFFVRTTGAVASAGGGEARRTLAVVARVYTLPLEPPAALQTIGDVTVAGSAQIRGEDRSPTVWDAGLCPDPAEDLPGVITDENSTVTTSGANAVVTGDPPHVPDPDLSQDDFTQFGDMGWDELTSLASIRRAGGSIDPTAPSFNADLSCNTSDPLNWGDPMNPTSGCGNYFPIIHVAGNANIQSGGVGQGILLVDGDLDLRGNFQFFGVIIVQGAFNVQGGGASGPRISGGVMAANATLDVSQSIVGSSIVQNSRCAVRRAIMNNDAVNRLRVIQDRSWVDVTGASF